MTDELKPQGLDKLLADGKKHRINQELFDYFLEVLPPVCYTTEYMGERWAFGFAEGAEHVRLFKYDKGTKEYFATLTPWMNPLAGHGNIERQKNRLKLDWIKIGREDPIIRAISNPPFNTQSFHECRNDAGLIEKLSQINGTAGTAYYIADICFINQSGGTWLPIKGTTAMPSLPIRQIIDDNGAEAVQQIIDGVRAGGELGCRNLKYGQSRQ